MQNLSRSGKYIVGLVGITILILLVIGFNERVSEARRLSEQAEEYAAQVSDLELTKSDLETQIAYATSEAAVEEWAYEDARWIQEGDQLILPVSSTQSAPEEEATVVQTQLSVENWQVWWALFFDKDPP